MENTKSSNKNFGIVFGVFFAIILFYNFIVKNHLDLYYLLTSLFFFIFAYLYPNIFAPLNKVWIKFGEILGKVIAPIVMFIIYFGVVFLTSILLRIIKKDILNLKINKNSKTFWIKRDQKIGDMTRQF